MDLQVIDGEMNPDPMTVQGTKDLVEMFWLLKRKSIVKPIPNIITMNQSEKFFQK